MIKKSSLDFIKKKIKGNYHARAFESRQMSVFWNQYLDNKLDLKDYTVEFTRFFNKTFFSTLSLESMEALGYKQISSGIVKNLIDNIVDLIIGKGLKVAQIDNYSDQEVLTIEKKISELDIESFLQKAIFEFLLHGSALIDLRRDEFDNNIVKIHNPLSFFTIKDFNILYGITLFDIKKIKDGNKEYNITVCETHFKDSLNRENVLRYFYNQDKKIIKISDLPKSIKILFDGKKLEIIDNEYYLEIYKKEMTTGLVLLEAKETVGSLNENQGIFDNIFDLIWFYDQINSNLATDNFIDLAITYLNADVLDKDRDGQILLNKSKRELLVHLKSNSLSLKEQSLVEVIAPKLDYSQRLKLKEIVLQDILRAIGLAPITIGIVTTGIDGKELSERREEISFRTRNSYIKDLNKPLNLLKEILLPDFSGELEFKDTITSSMKSRLETANIAYALNLPKTEILKIIYPDYSNKQISALIDEMDDNFAEIDETDAPIEKKEDNNDEKTQN